MHALILAPLLALSPAQAPAQPPPLRHIVYSLSVDLTSNTQGSILTGDVGNENILSDNRASGTTGSRVGAGKLSTGKRVKAEGTLSIDVLQALADRSLVVRISESAQDRTSEPITLGVTAEGALVLDAAAAATILPEEMSIARLLARGLIAGHEVAPGSAWRIERHDVSDEDLRVRVLDANGKFTHIAIDGTDTSNRADGIKTSYNVDMAYDVLKTLPMDVTVHSNTNEDTNLHQSQVQMSATFHLRSDSMGA